MNICRFPRPANSSTLLPLAAAVLLIGGCASVPLSTEPMAAAETAVQHATTTSTNENAPAQLALATTKLADARKAAAAKDYARATMLAEEVQVDAQNAEAHAQAVRSQKAAQESQDAARALVEEANRKVQP